MLDGGRQLACLQPIWRAYVRKPALLQTNRLHAAFAHMPPLFFSLFCFLLSLPGARLQLPPLPC